MADIRGACKLIARADIMMTLRHEEGSACRDVIRSRIAYMRVFECGMAWRGSRF
jgi:hypothetical protein